MKVWNCDQGSQKWLKLRAGIPTASEFDRIITPTGKASTSFDGLLFDLLAERIMGRPRVNAVTMWMERGTAMEKQARAYYEFTRETTVQQVGFITNEDGTVGCSPDGLVDANGLMEIKCPSDGIHVQYLLSERGQSVDKAYKVQIQGQLWVTGRQWVDIISYHPDMPEALFRIERDEPFIELLADAVTKFSKVLESRADGLKAAGVIPARQPEDEIGVLGVTEADVEAILHA